MLSENQLSGPCSRGASTAGSCHMGQDAASLFSRIHGAGVTLLNRFVMKHLFCMTKNALVRRNSFPISGNHTLGVPTGRARTQPPLLLLSSPEGSARWALAFLPPFPSSHLSPSWFSFPCRSSHLSEPPAPTVSSVCQLQLSEVTLRLGPWLGCCSSASGKRFSTSPNILTTATFQGRCLCTLQLDIPNWLLCPMDLPKGCVLEPLSHTNPVKLTVPSGS